MPLIWDFDMNNCDDPLFQAEASLEKKLELESLAEDLLQDKTIPLERLSETGLVIEILMKIPFIATLLSRIKTTGVSVFSLATFKGELNEVRTPSFLGDKPFLVAVYKNLGLIAAIADFISIPLVFFASMLLRKPYPITLTKLGEWVYSGVLLALMCISIALPFTAPIIAGVLCALGFIYSSYLLYQFSEQRKELNRIIPINRDKIEAYENKIEEEKIEIRSLKAGISTASVQEAEHIETHLKQYQLNLANDYHELTTLINEEEMLEQELKALNEVVIYDKILGFALSTLTMIGFTIGLFNPVIGFVMLTSVAVVGALYGLARIIMPFFSAIGNTIKNTHEQNNENAAYNSSSKTIISSLITKDVTNDLIDDKRQESTISQTPENRLETKGSRLFTQENQQAQNKTHDESSIKNPAKL